MGFPADRFVFLEVLSGVLRFFQGVSEIDPQPLVALEVVDPVPSFGLGEVLARQHHPELEMGDGVGGHKKLKAEDPREEVVSYVGRPVPGVPVGHEVLADVVDDGV